MWRRSSRSVITLDTGSRGNPFDSLSKMRSSFDPTGTGLCCQANLAPRAELEVALLAAQAPDDPPGVAVDLEDRPGVAARDQQVAVRRHGDRVDVEVVPGDVAVERGRHVAVAQRHVVEAVPLEKDPAGGDVDLLDDPVVDRAPVAARLVVGLDQR